MKLMKLSYDEEKELYDYFSGKIEADISGLHCSLGNLQAISTPSNSRNSEHAYYSPDDVRFEAVRLERTIKQALSLLPQQSQDVLAVYFALQRPWQAPYRILYGSLANPLLYLTGLTRLDALHKTARGKKNVSSTIQAKQALQAEVKRAKQELSKAFWLYAKARKANK